jgi:lipopolysaccharide/colanic/teichoic acid biosynthesis glycosyltransferase
MQKANAVMTAMSTPRPKAGFDLDRLKSKRSRRRKLGVAAIALDLIAITTAYAVASLAYFDEIAIEMIGRILFSVLPIFLLFNLNNKAYSIGVLADKFRSAWRSTSGLVWASLLMFLIFFFLKISEEFSRILLGLGTLLAIGLISLSRTFVAQLVERSIGSDPFAYVCIYDGVEPTDASGLGAIRAKEVGLEPTPNDPVMLDRLGHLTLGLDGIVVHCPPERRERWAFMLNSLDVATEIVIPELTSLKPLAIKFRSGEASLVLGSGQLSLSQRLLKRSFDLVFTVALMPLLAPLLLIIALAVKLQSPGPVLFKQDRISRGNRKFKILKFRSMRIDVQDDAGDILTQLDDSRITALGGLLRKTSLDELPQFLNVLRGEMSIVGPRPHVLSAKAGGTLYWEVDEAYWHRHVVKPGITGLAQVRGHRGNTFKEKHLKDRLDADLEYVSKWSLANDLKIILRTLGVAMHRNAF